MNRFLKSLCELGEYNMRHDGFARMLIEQATRDYTGAKRG